MIIPDQKKAVMTIMAKRSPKDGATSSAPMKSEVVKEEDGAMDGRHAAAQDVMMAMHEKSAHKLMEALANFMDMHMSRGDKNDEEDELEE